ncbi:MAG: hypothetical protein UZ17_ACD001002740 [Acidobacteria bacterium OLB17]|nr:MAG: hypothetical protein UZ17_ACD001002740 [Acidobacteria bacterium OLB17]
MAEIEPPVEQAAPEAPTQDPTLYSRRPRKVYAGMWGPLEIAAVAVSGFFVFAAIALYAFVVAPSNNEVVKNRSEADRLEAERISAQTSTARSLRPKARSQSCSTAPIISNSAICPPPTTAAVRCTSG